MSKFQPSSQDNDGGMARRRSRVRPKGGLATIPLAVTRTMPVERIGRHSAVHYCPTCGQKRKACTCEAQ